MTIAIFLCQLSSCQAGQCDAPYSRQLNMVKIAVNQLSATPINTVTVMTSSECQLQCLAVDMCAYITFSQSTNTCTLYSSTATSSISVAAGLQIYASFHLLLERHQDLQWTYFWGWARHLTVWRMSVTIVTTAISRHGVQQCCSYQLTLLSLSSPIQQAITAEMTAWSARNASCTVR